MIFFLILWESNSIFYNINNEQDFKTYFLVQQRLIMPNTDQWYKKKTWMLCQSVFESWEDVSRQSLAWIQVSWGLKPTFKGKLEHESSPSSHPRLGSWPYNSVIINFLHLTSLYQAFVIIVSSLQNHNENLLTYTMTSFKHVEKFRTDLFHSNLVWVLVFVMLIYDNNISVHDKEFYDYIQIQSLTLALHTLNFLYTHRGQLQAIPLE